MSGTLDRIFQESDRVSGPIHVREILCLGPYPLGFRVGKRAVIGIGPRGASTLGAGRRGKQWPAKGARRTAIVVMRRVGLALADCAQRRA